MFWKWLWKTLAFLLVLAIFVGGGIAIYKAGFVHGVNIGGWETEGGSGIIEPPAFTHPGYNLRSYSRPFLMFPLFGLCFSAFLVLAFLGGIRHLVHYKMWRSAGMPGHEEIDRYWREVRRGPFWKGHYWKWTSNAKAKPDEGEDPKDGIPKDDSQTDSDV